MSFETVSVRMNRSDPSIRWGFLLGRRGNDTIITRVEKDSLSEKAGLREGDEVMSICDRSALDIHDAQRTADSARLEITFHLKRHVTSHNCLPWTLTEKDNKLFVEEIPAGFAKERIPTHSSHSSQNQFHSSQHQQHQLQQKHQLQHQQPSSGYSSQKHSSYSHSESRSGGGAPWSSERNIPIQQSNAYNSSYQQQNSKTQSSAYQGGAPFQVSPRGGQQGYHSTYSSETKTSHTSGGGGVPQPERVFHSPSSFASSMKNTGWNRDRQYQLSSTPSAPLHVAPVHSAPVPAAHSPNHHYSAEHFYNPAAAAQAGHANGTAAPQSYSYNNGTTAAPFGVGSGGVPLNQQTFINTTSPIPLGHSSLSPGGTKVFYHSPSSRTRSQLSPNASIHHLQYNSPMNLYSTDACAEQYEQQTGRGVETPSRTTTPAYLTSQTKRLIEEGDALRGPSPSAQSSSFKRISEAVGTPVHSVH